MVFSLDFTAVSVLGATELSVIQVSVQSFRRFVHIYILSACGVAEDFVFLPALNLRHSLSLLPFDVRISVCT